MRYRVPQNIDMEDKIIGPLTMAQFLAVMIGSMIIYVAFISLVRTAPILFWLIAIPIGLFTVAFAFMKIQDQPFPKFLASVALYLARPKTRIWQKDTKLEHLAVVTKNPTTPEEPSLPGQTIKKEQLGALTDILDRGGADNQQH